MSFKPVIIGGGPAGLSAAWHLAQHGVASVVLEQHATQVGGLSRTETYRGFRFDIGGHRFYSKSAEVERTWHDMLGHDLLSVERRSRIYYRHHLIDYPLRPLNAFWHLGPWQSAQAMLSFARCRLRPRTPEVSFEDWVINRFGDRLYRTFFQTYTEKVWGMACRDISADWAARRIMGLTLAQALTGQAGLRTLADRFHYPRLGPGMMWQTLADRLRQRGCDLRMGGRVEAVDAHGVRYRDQDGSQQTVPASHVISSMPLRDLLLSLSPAPPAAVMAAARQLSFREFLTVALMIEQRHLFRDQWLYVHEPEVRVARIQNYKNWSADMVPDPRWTCLGMEYFCFEGDGLWGMSDAALVDMAAAELCQLGLASRGDVVDGTVVRAAQAYPVYDREHANRLLQLKGFLASQRSWLQVCGRNGMHRYNNQDHAMLTGSVAARNLLGADLDPWAVNGEAEYLETRAMPQPCLQPA